MVQLVEGEGHTMLRRYTVTFFGLLLSVAASHSLGLSLGSAIVESLCQSASVTKNRNSRVR